MKACYDGNLALEMPRSYVPVSQDEMEYVDGGVAPIIPVIGTVIASGAAAFSIGQAYGENYYRTGGSWAQYKKDQWILRAAFYAFGGVGIVAYEAYRLGFENKFLGLGGK